MENPFDAIAGSDTFPMKLGNDQQKRGSLRTPVSQASTAPGTPFFSGKRGEPPFAFARLCSGSSTVECPLDSPLQRGVSSHSTDPFDALNLDGGRHRSPSLDSEEAVSVGMPTMRSKLGLQAQAQVEAEVWLEDQLRRNSPTAKGDQIDLSACWADITNLDEDPTYSEHEEDRPIDLSSSWQDIHDLNEDPVFASQEEEVFVPVLPPLQSDLGRWAQAEEDPVFNSQENAVFVAGLPPLQSDLARWAQAVEAGTTKSKFPEHAQVFHLAMPRLESALGQWAEGVVKAAAWLNDKLNIQAAYDGPALTPDGRAVDLDGGVALFFSHSKELSSGYEAKKRAKEEFRLMQAAKAAHTACEAERRIEACEVFSIDPLGVLRGPSTLDGVVTSVADRAKRFFLKRRARQLRSGGLGPQLLFGVDSDDRVVILAKLPAAAQAARAACVAEALVDAEEVFSIDAHGLIRGPSVFDGPVANSAERLRRFWLKRRARQPKAHPDKRFTLCIDEGNHALIYMQMPNQMQATKRMLKRKITAETIKEGDDEHRVVAVDQSGRLHLNEA